MILTEFDPELYERNRKREAYEEGREDQTIEAAKNFYKNGVSVELISKSLNISVEQVKELVKDIVPESV